jgi:hypothetical protein
MRVSPWLLFVTNGGIFLRDVLVIFHGFWPLCDFLMRFHTFWLLSLTRKVQNRGGGVAGG